MAELRHLARTLTNQNRIHEEIESRLKSENAWRSSFLSNIKIDKHREQFGVAVEPRLFDSTVRELLSSPGIVRLMSSRRTRVAGPVAHMGTKRNAHRILVGKPERREL